jgi:WD40 repeat protein
MDIGYNLSSPDRVYILPKKLKEISGITEIDSSRIACIQDEREIVFIYDLNSGQIISRSDYGYKGDYEGIARVDSTFYILRSDGEITRIENFETDKFVRSTFHSGIPWKDNEGICYDPTANYLLITSKEIPRKGSGNRDKRFIYGFDLTSKRPVPEPVFTIDLSVIDSFSLANTIKVPMKDKKKGKSKDPDIRFQVSDLAFHPLTGKLFLLSSADKLLFVFNTKNELEYIGRLNPDLFIQPEGITFMKNGDMYISNEGQKKSATLVRFNYRSVKAGQTGS